MPTPNKCYGYYKSDSTACSSCKAQSNCKNYSNYHSSMSSSGFDGYRSDYQNMVRTPYKEAYHLYHDLGIRR